MDTAHVFLLSLLAIKEVIDGVLGRFIHYILSPAYILRIKKDTTNSAEKNRHEILKQTSKESSISYLLYDSFIAPIANLRMAERQSENRRVACTNYSYLIHRATDYQAADLLGTTRISVLMEEIISIVLMSIFAVFVIIYDIITFLFYMIFVPRKTMALTKSIKVQRVKAGSGKHETYASRGPPMNKENYYSHFGNAFDIINSSINEHRYRRCLGTREILKVKESSLPDGTKMYKYTIGSYKWMTYNAVKDNIVPLSRGFHSIGIEPKMSVALYLDTRPEWMLSALACFYRKIIVIILDTSMEYVGLGHALWETAPSALITSEELLPRVTKHIENVASIKTIVYVGQNEEVPNLGSLPEKISIYSYEEVFERGKNLIIEGSPPHSDDIAVITITRGTDGPSKPYAVTHHDLVTAMLSYQSRLYFTSRDVMICYLPASNFIEFVLALTITMVGGSIGFSSTLMNQDRNKNIIFGAHSDASILRPTVMFAYPQLLVKFNKSINHKIEKLRIFSRSLVKFGMKYKKFWMAKGYRTPLIDRVIFSNSAMMIGGKMRIIICGGSYLPAQTQIYSSITLCAPVVQLYLQAESADIGFCQSPDDRQMGSIGKPMEGIYVRLQDISEDYCKMRTSASHLIIGRFQFSQWSTSLPDQNDDSFEDGDIRWVHTGDVVKMHRDGSFEFIDRKANIIRLLNGNCVALGKLEAMYAMSPWVNYIYLYGDEIHKSLVAILIVNKDYIPHIIPSTDSEIPANQQQKSELKIKTTVAHHVFKHAKSLYLLDYEIPAAIMLEDNAWTLESGLLNTSYELRRALMYEKYESQIAFLYEVLTHNQRKVCAKDDISVFFADQCFSTP